MQLGIDFDSVHKRENNPESQAVLDERREEFNEQCWKVLKRMLRGERLTVAGTAQLGENYISSLPRRAKDLVDNNAIPITIEWAYIDGVRQKFKEYYIKTEDIPEVMERILGQLKPIN